MTDQSVPSTPEGNPPAEIADALEAQWYRGDCTNVPQPAIQLLATTMLNPTTDMGQFS